MKKFEVGEEGLMSFVSYTKLTADRNFIEIQFLNTRVETKQE